MKEIEAIMVAQDATHPDVADPDAGQRGVAATGR